MATTTRDLISASRSLDPASRALLNLWLHRGLDDVAIARLSGGGVEDVAERRRRLVDHLAGAVGSPPAEVRAALERMAGGEAGRQAVSQAQVEGYTEHERPETPSAAARRAAERDVERRGRPAAPHASPIPVALGFALGGVFVAMVAIAALTGGSGAEPATAPPRPTALEPVPGGPAGIGGTIVARANRVQVSITGLARPAADYEVWLFNSVADAESLGRLDERRFRLPRGRRRFRYLDVSLEPRSDPATAHSGRTVLRARAPG